MNEAHLLVSIFFIYLGAASGAVNNIFSCQFQKFMAENVIFRHLSLIMTIFIRTFIVGWYTPEAIISERDQDSKLLEGMVSSSKTSKNKSGVELLLEYGGYTLLIYLIILLTSHCELPYLLVFLGLVVILLFTYLYDLFESSGNPDKETEKWNAGILEYITIGVLITGVVMYTIRQYNDYSKKWNTLTFIFGKPKCGK
jgi:membrane protein implicated in regulation of membrane protease activity